MPLHRRTTFFMCHVTQTVKVIGFFPGVQRSYAVIKAMDKRSLLWRILIDTWKGGLSRWMVR